LLNFCNVGELFFARARSYEDTDMVRRILWRYVEIFGECMAGRTGYELMDFSAAYQGRTVGTPRSVSGIFSRNLAELKIGMTEAK